MSLLGSIHQAKNSLDAAQIGLQVVGQNIANASTPGYTREKVVLEPAPTQRLGGLLLGMGVEVKGVVQVVDKFLDERLRGATSDRSGADVQQQAYLALEGLIGELSDTDLSSSLNRFFAALSEVVNQPEDLSIRQLAIHQGETLAGDIRHLSQRVVQQRIQFDSQVARAADDINRLTDEIGTLNNRIVAAEGGDVSASDAVGLRDQRHQALTELSELIGIKVVEQDSGAVNVFVRGEYLVFEAQRREVTVSYTTDRGLSIAQLRLSGSDAPLPADGGEVGGLLAARDDVLGGFLDQWDDFAATLAFELNKVDSSGQGMEGFGEVTSQFEVQSAEAPLDEAGLPFAPTNGALQVLVRDKQSGTTQTTSIRVDLNGLDEDTSLLDLAAAFDSVEGVSASISPRGALTIAAESDSVEFSFADDSSGILAALGINTFFSGTTASTIDVQADLKDHPARFAASRGGIGEDSENAVELAGLLDRQLESAGGESILSLYQRLVGQTTQASTVARSVAEGFRAFEETLQGQRSSVSGVNLDEEAVRMLNLQKTYQASARYIATLTELLDILVNL